MTFGQRPVLRPRACAIASMSAGVIAAEIREQVFDARFVASASRIAEPAVYISRPVYAWCAPMRSTLRA